MQDAHKRLQNWPPADVYHRLRHCRCERHETFATSACHNHDRVLKPSARLPKTNQIDKADIFGQRGYAGAMFWKAVVRLNEGWMAVGNVCRTTLA